MHPLARYILLSEASPEYAIPALDGEEIFFLSATWPSDPLPPKKYEEANWNKNKGILWVGNITQINGQNWFDFAPQLFGVTRPKRRERGRTWNVSGIWCISTHTLENADFSQAPFFIKQAGGVLRNLLDLKCRVQLSRYRRRTALSPGCTDFESRFLLLVFIV